MWHDQDWTTCYREEVLNKSLPLIALVTSLLLVIVQRASSKRRKAKSALRVARLDPDSSTIVAPAPSVLEGSTTVGKSSRRRQSSINSYGGQSHSSERHEIASSAAALAIFHVENAVLLNEVHKIIEERIYNPLDPNSQDLEADTYFSARTTERIKRIWELSGSILSASVSLVAVLNSDRNQIYWLSLWVSQLLQEFVLLVD
jgi:hypothetical protein